MKTENRHINFQEPEGMMLLRYIKDTASNEEKSYIEAWLEADVNPAKRKAMVMKNETCFLKQKRNALQKF